MHSMNRIYSYIDTILFLFHNFWKYDQLTISFKIKESRQYMFSCIIVRYKKTIITRLLYEPKDL